MFPEDVTFRHGVVRSLNSAGMTVGGPKLPSALDVPNRVAARVSKCVSDLSTPWGGVESIACWPVRTATRADSCAIKTWTRSTYSGRDGGFSSSAVV